MFNKYIKIKVNNKKKLLNDDNQYGICIFTKKCVFVLILILIFFYKWLKQFENH